MKSFLLVMFFLGLTFGFYKTLSYVKEKPCQEPITTIVQTGPLKEGLKTDHLAEILHLSIDKPRSITPEAAEKLLLKHPLIKKVAVSLLNPQTLYIDYTLRSPLFTLIDYENRAVDEEGKVFPIRPYLTPKNLPELSLGESDLYPLALELLDLLGTEVERIDLSRAKDPSLGKREVVVVLSKGHTLRLTPRNYHEELERYDALELEEGVVIDLRVPKLAYITSD
ncbi:cell division protein FtsQ/DivIB [Candidatus Neptunochlamydia vexilliferae]|uniref:POTRA domain-containing protein n=1 Tax=Candidatus Neptunichlamydia vexilliferae TaxID=1651774 RepID=A0ABS0AYY7_9BACT|nr:hypothetical protein [Candidatus Neptunochlamydia vexilliferae]MBF5059190.1 hypothetical protein [Candidatus Neptunochlamydia vexilliferae]